MATPTDATNFFKSRHFAVAGASNNPDKWGHTVFKWYIDHALPTTPINPTSPTITITGSPTPTSHPALRSLADLPDPRTTSLSIITPPSATREILRQAKDLGIRAVWLQPGSFDAADLAWARAEMNEVTTLVGGPWSGGSGAEDGAELAGRKRRGEADWCVLVDGEEALMKARRGEGVQ